jgi:hypothetical protein
MSGGRPRGAKSWHKNPANIAALHMQTIEAHWLIMVDVPPNERYLTAGVKRYLADRAIAHVMRVNAEAVKLGVGSPMKRPNIDQVLIAHRRMGRAKPVRDLVVHRREAVGRER